MKLFRCQKCANRLYFENSSCEKCGHVLGYLPEQEILAAVEPDGATWIAIGNADGRYRFCANWELHACNWLISSHAKSSYCSACQHNDVVPDVSNPANRALWLKLEEAKRRLFYSLIKLRLPLGLREDGEGEPLEFRFLSDLPGHKIMTGHDNGLITIALKEADDATREKRRASMNEPYRTLLGHFRHEVGHYYWDKLVRDGDMLDDFRHAFGDERMSYEEALERHHALGVPLGWQDNFVSAYATMHPWEDFAETWAHYLHICDTLEMAQSFGLSVYPTAGVKPATTVQLAINPYHSGDMKKIIADWLPITFAVNCLNRAMGQPDLYPFVVSEPVVQKLDYIQQLVQRRRTAD